MKELFAVLLVVSFVAIPTVYVAANFWNHVESELSEAFSQ